MELERISGAFTVCKVEKISDIDFTKDFTFYARTDEEISLVCRTEDLPGNLQERSDKWRAFRVKGVLNFSLVGILSRISTTLADDGISLFAVSTFNTDYILVKEEFYERALEILSALS